MRIGIGGLILVGFVHERSMHIHPDKLLLKRRPNTRRKRVFQSEDASAFTARFAMKTRIASPCRQQFRGSVNEISRGRDGALFNDLITQPTITS